MGKEEENQGKTIPVRVAVRIRPLVKRELREGCEECIDVTPDEPQVVFRNADKAFTFDYVFSTAALQATVYESAVAKVVKNLFQGYNVTVLAYGQTGSGKTHTMGTAYVQGASTVDEIGVIPRAVQDIFKGVEERPESEFLVKVSFIELYKENLYDLLGGKNREESAIDIREDPRGGIIIPGLTELPVKSLQETMQCLEMGAQNRATGATAMNAHSSRSHAIFSLHIEQRKETEGESIISAKFHMVDLAGSERAKKTGASGERLKEGININKGLLALGNVISALGDENHRGHVPYRDSKLTRLLQDSLGGNSHTIMVACISPADSNFEETISTLRYADRARKIKNKPVVNRDPHAAELARLRQQVQQLQVQLLATQGSGGGDISATSTEVRALLAQNHSLQEENEKLTRALQLAIDENTNTAEKALMAEMARDRLKTKLEELKAQTGNAVDNLNKTLDVSVNPHFSEQLELVKALQNKIMELQADQQKNEKAMMNHELSRHNISVNTTTFGNGPVDSVSSSDEQESDDTSPSKDFGTAFTLRQAKLNEELHELNKALTLKEELMVKMSANDDRFVSLKASYEKNVKDLEEQVNIISKERDQLNQQLRTTHAPAASKIAEQRRKRLQELEAQMQNLKKKIAEQSKMLKMKEQTEKQVNKLSSEIQNMKAARVKLIRQMKEDNEKFRVWKAQKDREVAKLKQEDRKKQYQIVKMERLHTKQQNVLKRKMEEAIAINKRLKDAMALQKAGAERRATSKGTDNMANKVKSWLDGELGVVTVKKQAKHTLDTLIDDRKTISDQINKVKRQLGRIGLSSALEGELQTKKKNLENDLQLRTAQINDLQSKIMDGDQDNAETSSKKRFESIQSMIEAKVAMNYLFDIASTHQATVFTKDSEFKDIQAHNEELMSTLEETESEVKALKEVHATELNKLSREYEDKTLFLLRQMPKAKGGMMDDATSESEKVLLERLQFQEEEIARLSKIHEELQQKTEECNRVKKEMTTAALTKGRVSLMPELVPFGRTRKEKKPEPVQSTIMEKDLFESDTESDSDPDNDPDNDPDWKMTPLYKKIKKITRTARRDPNEYNSPSDEDQENNKKANRTLLKGIKRDSSGETKCGCKLNCSTKRCKCRSDGRSCGTTCKCNVLKCQNKTTPESTFSEPSEGDTLLNSTFDVEAKPLREINTNSDSPTKKLRFSTENEPSGVENVDTSKIIKPRIPAVDYYPSPNLF